MLRQVDLDKGENHLQTIIILTMFSFFSRFKKSDELPDCNDLYVKYVHKWNDNPDHKVLLVKPDMLQSFDPNTDFSTMIDGADQGYLQIKKQVEAMTSVAREDLLEIAKFDEFNLESIDKLDKAIDRKYIKGIIDTSDANDDSNHYLISIIEFGCALSEAMRKEIGGFIWVYDHPYWESTMVHKKTGFEIPVFHWAIKKFSEYGVDDGFKDKILALKQTLEDENSTLQ
jgi:hypothetical protein